MKKSIDHVTSEALGRNCAYATMSRKKYAHGEKIPLSYFLMLTLLGDRDKPTKGMLNAWRRGHNDYSKRLRAVDGRLCHGNKM